MNNKVFIKLAIATIIDIIIFSPGIIGLTFSTNAVLFCLTIIANIAVLTGEYVYITRSTTAKYGYDLDKLKDANDYKEALESKLIKKSPFYEEVKKAISQLTSMTRKRQVLAEILEQNNQRKILNRISIFDSDINGSLENEHKLYIKKLLDSNENMLIEFNKLLTEVSQMDDTSSDDTLSKVLNDMTNSLKTLRGESDSL